MEASNFRLPPAQWAELRRLLAHALDLPPTQREAWLNALPPEHIALAPRLRALLSHDHPHGAARDTVFAGLHTLPKIETREFAPRPSDAEQNGDTIGPYKLLRLLGEGGTASVWLAEHTALDGRRVALKLPHGAWRRAGLVERFARERAILAGLEHPHIGRLYDAGVTPAGQPYLALEYVDGERIDRWCDARQLDVPGRLVLFLQVCEAVAHAHARLVVHRDIKPSNVLVDAGGQVRLLDFGIAKLLEGDSAAETALTREAGRALTPEYAAPEQLTGAAIGTATDTYAMGVVLYELLAGRHPFVSVPSRHAFQAQAQFAVEPARPSNVAVDAARTRALRGDLDVIVLKAMKRRPERRYASAEALAADIRRHLAHEPVLARPDGKAYRLRKWLRRHRVAAGAGTAVASALIAGAALAAWQAHEARLQRDAALLAKAQAETERAAARRAERNANAETDLAEFLLMELSGARGGDELAAPLERARKMFDTQYANEPALRGRLLLHMGSVFNGRNDVARAAALWAEAEPLLRDHGEWPALAEMKCYRARAFARDGQLATARANLVEAREWLARAGAPADAPTRRDCLSSESAVERAAGNLAGAATLIEAAVAMEQGAGRTAAGTFVELLNEQARVYVTAARYRDAVAAARRAAALVAQLGLDQTTHLMTARRLEAQALREGGRPLDALTLQAADVARSPRISERSQYIGTLLALGRLDEIAPRLGELVAASRTLGPNTVRAVRLQQVEALVALGRLREARAALDDADALFAPLVAARHYGAHHLMLEHVRVALATGDVAAAQRAVDDAAAIAANASNDDPPDFHAIKQWQARAHLAAGRGADALAAADSALAWSQRKAFDPEASLHVAQDLMVRAQALRMMGDGAMARSEAARAEGHARASGGEAHPLVRLAQAEAAR